MRTFLWVFLFMFLCDVCLAQTSTTSEEPSSTTAVPCEDKITIDKPTFTHSNITVDVFYIILELNWTLACFDVDYVENFTVILDDKENKTELPFNENTSFYLEITSNMYEFKSLHEYVISVVAVLKDGTNVTSNTEDFETPLAFPSEPERLDVQPEGNSTLKITWEKPTIGEESSGFNYTVTITPDGPVSDSRPVHCSDENETVKVQETENTFYTFTDGLPYHKYIVTVTAHNSKGDGLPTLKEGQTGIGVPGKPTDLKWDWTSDKHQEIRITWKTSCNINGPLTGYNIIWKGTYSVDNSSTESKSDNVSIAEKDDYEYILTSENLQPSTYYTINLHADGSTISGEEGEIHTDKTADAVPGKPKHLDPTKNNTSFSVSWDPPEEKRGQIINYHVTLTSKPLNGPYNSDCPLPEDQQFETKETKFEKAMDFDYVYNITVKAETSAGIGKESGPVSVKNELTSAPESSEDLTLQIVEDSELIMIKWKAPCKTNGPLKGFLIYWFGKYIDTGIYDKGDHNFTVENSEINQIYNFTFKYQAWFNYLVKVVAYGNDKSQEFVMSNITSPAAAPEPVNIYQWQVNTEQTEEYNASIDVRYDPPIRINGPFLSYRVEYRGYRPRNPDHAGINRTKDIRFIIEGIKPDYDYDIYVYIETENFTSIPSNRSVHTPSGVPFIPDVTGLNSSITIKGSSEVEFSLRKHMFDDTNGEILYYAILVSTVKTDPTFGFWDGLKERWPKPKYNEQIQVTEVLWSPFHNSDKDVRVVIGTGEENCEMQKICNGSLEADTDYYLVVRGLTKETYRDSVSIHFKTDTDVKLGLILGLVFGLGAVAAGTVVGFFLWRKKILLPKPSLHKEKPKKLPGPITIKQFPNYYSNLREHPQKVKNQYDLLQEMSKEEKEKMQCTFAVLPENKRKNRYTNILPFDETRVKLTIDEDDEIASDYINASFIKGYSGSLEYIATQGPLPDTCKDFWKMIMQENVTIIVMVAQFIECDKRKCHEYFPKVHENMILDDMELRCVTELHFGTYCIRTIQVKKNVTQVTVTHMQFLDWPDFGVPTGTENMLQFCQQLRDRVNTEGGNIVVHCSAGVGRTGTLIALDILLQTIKEGRSINIFKTVLDLRKQRTNMVQTERQYMYIHACINDMIQNPFDVSDAESAEPLYENLEAFRSSKSEDFAESAPPEGGEEESKF